MHDEDEDEDDEDDEDYEDDNVDEEEANDESSGTVVNSIEVLGELNIIIRVNSIKVFGNVLWLTQQKYLGKIYQIKSLLLIR